ncbi:MAG: molybdopterin cofactor-binding domain-containing protein [Paraglaciecola sp.]|uniref:xanthine dehydrogenase family protein molybdopterin-binding subunit n=1 Tax=Paraglaciecola sp. TaxID=1920173 RepID=UPI00329816CD
MIDKQQSQISRRQFLATTGGVTIALFGACLFPGCTQQNAQMSGDVEWVEKEVGVWVRLLYDGQMIIYTPSAEMGQGSMTSVPLILAEEMDADWSQVRVLQSPVDAEVYGLGWSPGRDKHMTTAGSRSIRHYYQLMRETGAQIRMAIRQNAANKWQVHVSEVITQPGEVLHEKSNRKMSFAEVAKFGNFDILPSVDTLQLKDPKEFRLIGKDIPRQDIPEKTNGTAQYAIDVQLPGMLFGFINRSAAHGAKPKLTNKQAILAIEGVKSVVELAHGIGVLATSIESGLQAKGQMQIEWGSTLSDSHNSVEDLAKYTPDGAQEIRQQGDVQTAFQMANSIIEASTTNKYVYHGQMEPLNAVVFFSTNKKSAEVWVGSQAPDRAQKAVAEKLGLEVNNVAMNLLYLGGGFGRRSLSDYVAECAELAASVPGLPVKLIWTREDDLAYGAFRPQLRNFFKAGIDKQGRITAWQQTAVGPGGNMSSRGAEISHYDIPHVRLLRKELDHGIRTKHFRSVGHGTNKFAIETFIDQIARSQNKDPYQYRLAMMQGNARARKVLERAVEMSAYDPIPKEGTAMGIAFADRDAYTCGVAQISLNRDTGVIRVHKYWCACDGGVVVQPKNAIRQIKGAVIMGISLALKEQVDFSAGKVVQSNYTDYPILRMSEMPESIDVDFIYSEEVLHGLGETGLPATGGAIASAFAALTGKYLNDMPFTPERVLQVLNS